MKKIKNKIYCVDVDGTICSHEKDYSTAKPFKRTIALLNMLFDKGHKIIYFTARGTVTGIDWREVTEAQFKKWGVKYNELHFGKPYADHYIDDKNMEIPK